MPNVQRLYLGRLHIRFDNDADLGFLDKRCFVMLPPGFDLDVIPDDYIHEPAWNSAPVNRWWQTYHKAA